MKTRGLDQHLPPHSIAAESADWTDWAPPTPPGGSGGPGGPASEPARELQPGDFLLSRAHGFRHTVLQLGQALRLPAADRPYAAYTHAALVVSASGEVVEAIGEGVRPTSLQTYVMNQEIYQVVRIEASDAERKHIVEFATFVLSRRSPYAFLAIACTTLWAFTGSRLMFFMDGSFTCSGLVAEALVRMGATFGVSSARMMPAQLAVFFGAPPPPADFAPARRWPLSRARRR